MFLIKILKINKLRRLISLLNTKNIIVLAAGSALFLGMANKAIAEPSSFTAFESGQVRPLAILPGGKKLVAVNTPDNRLEIFKILSDGKLELLDSVPVGLEPISVAVKNDKEVWVVNHLSDSISIVDINHKHPQVVRTLLVGDEPRDIVFAGHKNKRAFITTAHRGQNNKSDPQIFTPGVGRADVWVFDADKQGHSMGGDPLTILTLFTDTPRALAVSPDGKTVYAAGFQTGNQTTALTEGAVCDGGKDAAPCVPVGLSGLPIAGELEAPGGLPAPNETIDGIPAPEVGLIVKYNGTHWVDELGRNWDNMVRFNLPDQDVFAIDATADTPTISTAYAHVGTVLFNMITNPVTGKLYVSNTDAVNEVRFEGSREPGSTITTVQGKQHLVRITVIDSKGNVTPRHLNKHIDYSLRPAPTETKAKSLSGPMGMAVSNDGSTLYMAAFGSSKVGIFNTSELENDTFVPDASNHISLTGGGPSGLVIDKHNKYLYVLTRFDNSISTIDLKTKSETNHYAMYNPEPASLVNGRKFLYDATITSSNGEGSCASCHVFADFDSLAWDLGDPTGSVITNPGPFTELVGFGESGPLEKTFHPMKGPMTTQSLRGLADQGPMHWRGDRTGGNDEVSVRPDSGSYNEDAGFKKFNPAFVGLNGAVEQLSDEDMQAFTDFILQIKYPPNPLANLDGSLTPIQQAGKDVFLNESSVFGQQTCTSCHALDRDQGLFGGDTNAAFTGQPQLTKTTHLRNMYQKVGMFGMPVVFLFDAPDGDQNNDHKGDQVRGYGYLHDGSVDTLDRFSRAGIFVFPGSDPQRRQVSEYELVISGEMLPIVGQQITLTSKNKTLVDARINLLIERATAGDCDLIVKGSVKTSKKSKSSARGWYMTSNSMFISDMESEAPYSDTQLRKLATNSKQNLTYTCVPPGSGKRLGIDRDNDGVLDGDATVTANDDDDDDDDDKDENHHSSHRHI